MSDSDDTSADIYGAVAQLVAHSVVSRKVAGSSPVCSASRGKKDSCPFGTFMVSYHDTLFRSRVEGWMDALKDQMPG